MNKVIRYVGIVVLATVPPTYVAAVDSAPRDNSRVSAAPIPDGSGQMNSTSMDSTKMQERMLRMHDQMHKIMNTKEGVERERLLQEQRMMIEENMRMLPSMGGMN